MVTNNIAYKKKNNCNNKLNATNILQMHCRILLNSCRYMVYNLLKFITIFGHFFIFILV